MDSILSTHVSYFNFWNGLVSTIDIFRPKNNIDLSSLLLFVCLDPLKQIV